MLMIERSNEEWLNALRGPEADQAIADLREILIRGLHYALSNSGEMDTLIEDFVQDALLKILGNLDNFRGESKLTTWAQKIAVRVAYTELRRKRWKDISIEDLLPEDSGSDFTPAVLTDPKSSPERSASQKMLLELVERLIEESLTPRQREAIMAVMVGGMPLDEAARRMATNRNALYKLIHDARKRLKQELLSQGYTTDELLAAFETS